VTTQPIMRANIGMTCVLLGVVISGNSVAQNTSLEVSPPRTAAAGATITVKWSGPNGAGDYITVVGKGAPPTQYLDYKNTSEGRAPVNPVSLVLPAEPGEYEIRYLRGTPRSVLASVPYEVSAVTATLEGPANVAPGAKFDIAWTGPNNRRDWVTIVAVDAAPRAYASYVDAPVGRVDGETGRRVATLQAPAQPGRYELRYVQQGVRVIGRRAIEVTSAAGASPTAIIANTNRSTPASSAATVGTASINTTAPSSTTPASTAAPTATLQTGRARDLPMTAGAQQALADATNAAAETACAIGTNAPCATITGPARLTARSTGDFSVTLRNVGATTVTTNVPSTNGTGGATVTTRTDVTADFKFDSGEGESQNRTFTVLHSAPASFAPASVTFTFQAAGTFTVVANVLLTARTSIQTDRLIAESSGGTQQYRTQTDITQRVDYWPVSVKKVVTVAP
jgi:hypothetical protein